jgi:hypothetical protein
MGNQYYFATRYKIEEVQIPTGALNFTPVDDSQRSIKGELTCMNLMSYLVRGGCSFIYLATGKV